MPKKKTDSAPPKIGEPHTLIIGSAARGTSRVITHLIQQDILEKRGLCLINPHGTLVEELIAWCATNGITQPQRGSQSS